MEPGPILVWNAPGFERSFGGATLLDLLAQWDRANQPYVASDAGDLAVAIDQVLEHVNDTWNDEDGGLMFGNVPALCVANEGNRPGLVVWCGRATTRGSYLLACSLPAILPGLAAAWTVSRIDGRVEELPLGQHAAAILAGRWNERDRG